MGDSQAKSKKKPPLPIYFEVGPKIEEKSEEQIYKVSNELNLTKPYSNMSEWQNVVTKSTSGVSDEELFSKILNLRNRNWVLE